MPAHVRHLRVAPRPFDWERDDDAVEISLHPAAWSLLVLGAERSEVTGARDIAAQVALEVRRVQHLRHQAAIADAEHDYRHELCDLPDGA